MIFSTKNWKDIQRYYEGTFVKFKETGERLWWIKKVLPDEVKAQDVDGFEVSIDLSEDYEITYALPSRAVYQDNVHASILIRIPAKQYYRGINSSNTKLMRMSALGSWHVNNLSFEKLQQFVDKPSYQCYPFNTTYESWALTPDISLCKIGTLYCGVMPIGSLDLVNNKGQVKQLFKEDVLPLFPGVQITYD